jgi:hypothetical protein
MNRAIIEEITALQIANRSSLRKAAQEKLECQACSFNHRTELNWMRTQYEELQKVEGFNMDNGQAQTLQPLRNSLSLENLISQTQGFDAADKAVNEVYSHLTTEQKLALTAWFTGGRCTLLELNDRDRVIQLRRSLAAEASRPPRRNHSTTQPVDLNDLLSM